MNLGKGLFALTLVTFAAITNAQFLPFYGWGGWINPLAVWAYGGPGIGAPVPDIGIAGMSDYVINLPQPYVPPAAAYNNAASSKSVVASIKDADKLGDSANKTVDTRGVKGDAISGNARSKPSISTLSAEKKVLDVSLAKIAQELAAAPKDVARPKV